MILFTQESTEHDTILHYPVFFSIHSDVRGNAQFVQKVTSEPLDFKQNRCGGWNYYKSCYGFYLYQQLDNVPSYHPTHFKGKLMKKT